MCANLVQPNSPSTLQYSGEIKIHFQETSTRDALYFRIEFDKTVWVPFTGNHEGVQEQSILDRWLWDPITPLYNPVVYTVNAICSRVIGKRPFSYHIDQNSAFTVLDQISRTYHEKFEGVQEGRELEGLTRIYCNAHSMQGYMDGKPRSRSTAFGIQLRDAARPVATALSETVHKQLPYFSFPCTSTPWTGMAGYAKDTGCFLGRAANGGGRKKGWSETGLILEADKRGEGYGKQAILALAVHAWFFKCLSYPVGNEVVTHFTATASPNNQKSKDLANLVDAEVLMPLLNPYSQKIDRHLYGISADRIEEVLAKFINPEAQITINGRKPSEFFK